MRTCGGNGGWCLLSEFASNGDNPEHEAVKRDCRARSVSEEDS